MLNQKTFLCLLILATIFGGEASRGVHARLLSTNATAGNFTLDTPILPDSQTMLDESVSANTNGNRASIIISNTESLRTTMSSIFLRNLTNDMDPELSELFSVVALDFLRYHSMSSELSEEIDFVMVEVMGQAPEFGNSTQEDAHVDGINVFFETIVDLDDSSQIDLPRTIESIFRNNKKDLFVRLAEADNYFVPLYGKSHIIYETQESLTESLSEFVRTTWVASSLAAAACSILITSALLVGKRSHSRRDYRDDKDDTFPLRTLQTSSDDSTPTNQSSQDHRQIGKVTNSYDSANILMDLEGDYLDGLELVRENSKYRTNRDKDEESVGSRARMRKRQIELALAKSRSEEGPSMEAILVATSSLRSDEESEGQKRGRKSANIRRSIEPQKTNQRLSFMEQISSVFRSKSNKPQARRLEPVPMNQDDGSVLSFMSTPHSSTNGPKSFREEDKYLGVPKSILKVDKCESPEYGQNFSRFHDPDSTQVEDYYHH